MTCKMTLRIKLRMTINMKPRITFKTLDFKGVSREDFEGVFKRAFKGDSDGDLDGDFKVHMGWVMEADLKENLERDMEGDWFNFSYLDIVAGLVL